MRLTLAFILLFLCTATYADRPNVLLICVDDLRPELGCFGKNYIHSPNIDRLANEGVSFSRHYVQAPTCGASRYTLLTGTYGPRDNGALFARARRMAKATDPLPLSMPGYFRNQGYTTVSVGKVSHHPGGRGGKDWNDDAQPEMPDAWDRHLLPAGPWQHPRGAMHGLANGEIRGNAKDMDVFQSVEGDDSIYPDGLIVNEGLEQLNQLAANTKGNEGKPFFLAIGIIRPHLPFGAPAKYISHYRDAKLPPIPHPKKPTGKTTWHGSGEFMKYNRWKRDPNKDAEFATDVRKHYAACVTYADAQVGRILERLNSLGLTENTIVVLWGDHGWHLGEHAVWGKHTLFDESLRSPLIIRYQGIPNGGVQTDAIIETLDVFPTLCELAEVDMPGSLDGQSLVPIIKSPETDGHPAISYNAHRTIRTENHRLIVQKNGFVELYDHRNDPGETNNIAEDHPSLVKELTAKLTKRLGR